MTIAGAISSETLRALVFEVLQLEERLKGLVLSTSKRLDCYKLAKEFERSFVCYESQIKLASDDELKITVTIAFIKELDEFEIKFLELIRR